MNNKSVGWQFFEDGQWWTGFDTNNHRKNTEEAGIPVRDVYIKSDEQPQEPVEGLESFYVQQNKDLFWEVYRILYASELNYHLFATFRHKEDMENYTKGDYTCP